MSPLALCLVPLLVFAGGDTGGIGQWAQHPTEDNRPRVRPASEAGSARVAGELQRAAAADIELSADDGSADGTALHMDNIMVVARLTPKVYPVQLKAIRILFVKIADQPDPTGRQVRLVAFTDPLGLGKPPERPKLVIDQMVRIPETGRFVEFPVAGPVMEQGDLYVGYQAPSPATGVGFAADTNGPQREKGFYSIDGGLTFKGPIAFGNGTAFNPMLRAMVAVSSPGGPLSEELAVDDGTIETGIVAAGRMYVNRLTPTRYPAKLNKVRVFIPWFTGRPSPEGRRIRLVVFRDPQGSGKPPAAPAFDIDRQETIRGTGDFFDFAITGVSVDRGDLYVGYQAPDPHDGVGFALDWSGAKAGRSYRSLDAGKSFDGPFEVTLDNVTATANLMVRAVLSYGEASPPEATFRLECNKEALDLREGGQPLSIEAGIRNYGRDVGKVKLSARLEPADVRVQVAVTPSELASSEVAVVTLAGLEPGAQDNFRLVLTAAAADGTKADLSLPVTRWRTVAEGAAGPDGGALEHSGVRVAVAPGGLLETADIRLNQGKPRTGFEANLASEVYQLEGLPVGFGGQLEWSFDDTAVRTAPFATRPLATVSPTHAVIASGQQARLIPVQGANPKITVDLSSLGLKDTSTVAAWLVHGYHTALTSSGRFEIHYGQGLAEAGAVGQLLERAADTLSNAPYSLEILRGVNPPVPVYMKDLGDTLFGLTDGETLQYNTRKFQTVADVQAFGETMGHELMHFVEARYGGNAPRGAGLRSSFPWFWLDEALSTWFEPLAAGQPGFIPTTVCPKCGKGANQSDNYRSFILRGLASPPGDSSDQEHGYGASMFLTTFFRERSDRLAALLAGRDPGSSPVEALAAQAGSATELAKAWSEFARLFYAGDIYAGRKFPEPSDLTVEAPDGVMAFPTAIETSQIFSWKQAPDLSMRPFSLKYLNPLLPDWTDEIVTQVRFDPPVADADLHAWLFSSNATTFLGSIDGNGQLLLPDARKLKDQRAVVLLGAVNSATSAGWAGRRDLTIKAEPAPPAVELSPTYAGFKGVIGKDYEFGTKNRNVPGNAEYEWSIGGAVKRGRKVSHRFSSAGEYNVSLRVDFGPATLNARTTITIAPDTAPDQKAEVLFDVYRRYRNSFGETNQKCNSYRVTAYTSSGAVLDSGESSAMNGAYTMNLPVGNGYGYRVDHTFPAPCAGSGTTSGKFDVKAGTINLVKVEAPACIQ